jgi:hypothetical protein
MRYAKATPDRLFPARRLPKQHRCSETALVWYAKFMRRVDNGRMNEPLPHEPPAPDSRRPALIGLIVVVVLVLGGLYLAHVIRGASQIQDCVLAGRSNCAPIEPGK